MMMNEIVEALVALLLLASGAVVLAGAIGVLRMRNFFQRMHAASLIPTLGIWCVALASMLYFSVLRETLVLYQVVVLVLLAITVPVPTMLLMRAALFRKRRAGEAAPAALDDGSLSKRKQTVEE